MAGRLTAGGRLSDKQAGADRGKRGGDSNRAVRRTAAAGVHRCGARRDHGADGARSCARFFHHDALLFEPTDLTQTNAALFFTSWITHFCAPVFFFLAGTSAFLSFGRGKSKNDLARFLVSRGLWLVFLELTVVRFGWAFNFDYRGTGLLVIWALGWSMVVLAALIYLPRWVIAAFAVLMIAGHNLLDGVDPNRFGALAWLWKILHVPGEIHPFQGTTFAILLSARAVDGSYGGGICFWCVV